MFSRSLLWTIEGQYEFRLGPHVATPIIVNGRQFLMPEPINTVEIGNHNLLLADGRSATVGITNSNILPMV